MEKYKVAKAAMLIVAAIVAAAVMAEGYGYAFARGEYGETVPTEEEVLSGASGEISYHDDGFASYPKMEYEYGGTRYGTSGSDGDRVEASTESRSHAEIAALAEGDSGCFYFRYYVVPSYMAGSVDMIEGVIDREKVFYHVEDHSYIRLCYDTECVVQPGKIVAIHKPNVFKYVGGCLLFPMLAILFGGMLWVMAMVGVEEAKEAYRRVKKHGL